LAGDTGAEYARAALRRTRGPLAAGLEVRTVGANQAEPHGKKSPVETYGTAAAAGPLCPRGKVFRASGPGTVRRGGRAGAARELEELVEQHGRQVERQQLREHLDLRALREERRESHPPFQGFRSSWHTSQATAQGLIRCDVHTTTQRGKPHP
jgi:hypothetical protein